MYQGSVVHLARAEEGHRRSGGLTRGGLHGFLATRTGTGVTDRGVNCVLRREEGPEGFKWGLPRSGGAQTRNGQLTMGRAHRAHKARKLAPGFQAVIPSSGLLHRVGWVGGGFKAIGKKRSANSMQLEQLGGTRLRALPTSSQMIKT